MIIPEWAWKVLSILIIPMFLWAINAHLSAQQQDLRISQLEQKSVQADTVLESQKESLYDTKKDIEILKVRMDYVAQGIDDIKELLSKPSP
mgnify:CR=1 FL=1